MSDTPDTPPSSRAYQIDPALLGTADDVAIDRDSARKIIYGRMSQVMTEYESWIDQLGRGPVGRAAFGGNPAPSVGLVTGAAEVAMGVLTKGRSAALGMDSADPRKAMRDQALWRLATGIADDLPASALNDNTLYNIDLRPLIKTAINSDLPLDTHVKMKKEGGITDLFIDDQDVHALLNDKDLGTDEVRAFAQDALVGLTQQEVDASAEILGRPLTAEEIAAHQIIDDVASLSMAGAKVAVDNTNANAGQQVVSQDTLSGLATGKTSAEDMLAMMEGGDEGVVGFGDKTLIREWLKSGQMDPGQIFAMEQEFEEPFGIDLGIRLAGQGNRPNDEWEGPRRSTTEAINYLYQLNEDELIVMQKRLRDAGYFDEVEEAPIPGYAQDIATQKAWQAAILDVMKTGQSLKQLVDGKIIDRQRISMARRSALPSIDVMAVRENAITKSSSLIGRGLTPDEEAELINHLEKLRGDRVGDLGYRPSARLDPGEVDLGYGEEDVTGYVETMLDDDVAAENTYDQFQAMIDKFGKKKG